MQFHFATDGEASAAAAAEAWCKARGIAVGPVEGSRTRALIFGSGPVAPWTELEQWQKDSLHGTMHSNLRLGTVVLTIDDSAARSFVAPGLLSIDVGDQL